MMKRILCLLMCMICLLPIHAAGAETLGFGFVNAKDVALRKAPGERRIHRLPKDACVWITDSQTDGKGTLWYKINVGVHENHTNYDFTGWIMAEFVDAGDDVWHDVASVSAGRLGMIALRTDGTVESAGCPCVINNKWTSLRGWADSYAPVRQAGVLQWLAQFVITEDGTYVSSDSGNRLKDTPLRMYYGEFPYPAISREGELFYMDDVQALEWLFPQEEPGPEALAQVEQIACSDTVMLMRTADGGVMAARFQNDYKDDSLPDWSAWTELTGISASKCIDAQRRVNNAYVGVRKDGSLLAEPRWLAEALSDWTDMAQVEVEYRYALGLRKDGTAVSVSLDGHAAPDVSSWRDVTAIAVADDYCVGIRRDGTLIFAGDHIFMREGNS